MTNKKLLILSIIALSSLASCNETPAQTLSIICPTGAPSLAFYDQGANENFETNSQTANVLATLKTDETMENYKDIVIFDSVTGLKTIKADGDHKYSLASIITGGNFYLVSLTKDADENGNIPMPSEGDKIVSFGKGLIPDLVYSKLAKDYWHINNTPTYVTGNVANTKSVIMTGKFESETVDYVFTAEPILTAAKASADESVKSKIKVVKNIRSEWKAYSGQDALAQAGVFVSKYALENKKSELETFLSELKARQDDCVNNVTKVVATLDAFGDKDAQTTKFGFNSTLVNNLQKDGKNSFGIVSSNENIDVNAFLTSLGQETFTDDYFVNL